MCNRCRLKIDCNVKADVSPLEKREKRNTKYCHLNATFSSRHQHLVIISNNKETWLKYWLDLPANKEARRFASLIFHPSQLWNKKKTDQLALTPMFRILEFKLYLNLFSFDF